MEFRMSNVKKDDSQATAAITRVGVYGVALIDQKILLTVKQSGPFFGLLDLPGGKIEFGESPLNALEREFREEVAMAFAACALWQNLSHFGIYLLDGRRVEFHHLGMIYKIISLREIAGLAPEEDLAWHPIVDLNLEKLTPFAKASVLSLVA